MIRRLTLTSPDGVVEAVQFTSGVIVADAHPCFGGLLHVWIGLDVLQEEKPDWPITWIDGDTGDAPALERP